MKQILFVNSHSDIGGGEIVLINLLKTIDRSAYNAIVTYPQHGAVQSQVQSLGYPVEHVKMSLSRGRGSRRQIMMNMARFLPSAWSTVRQITAMVRLNNIDILSQYFQ